VFSPDPAGENPLPPAGENPMTVDSAPNSLTLEDPLARIEERSTQAAGRVEVEVLDVERAQLRRKAAREAERQPAPSRNPGASQVRAVGAQLEVAACRRVAGALQVQRVGDRELIPTARTP
jgi:hypothetical protein